MSKQRLQFDVTSDVLELLDALKEQSNSSTRAELMRRAIKLYAILLQEEADGYKIHLIKNHEDKQLAIL